MTNRFHCLFVVVVTGNTYKYCKWQQCFSSADTAVALLDQMRKHWGNKLNHCVPHSVLVRAVCSGRYAAAFLHGNQARQLTAGVALWWLDSISTASSPVESVWTYQTVVLQPVERHASFNIM